ncbi:1772_t:CDS:1, partial [Paraglomus brasilianum]
MFAFVWEGEDIDEYSLLGLNDSIMKSNLKLKHSSHIKINKAIISLVGS